MDKSVKKVFKIDASDKILGKLSVEAANILSGKNQPDFQRNKVPENRVVIINADRIKVTGNKLAQKNYFRHSKYLGSLKKRNLQEAMDFDSRWVIKHAIEGMLPKNRLQKIWLKNLQIYKQEGK